MKKLLTMLLAATMVFNLAGCGNSEPAGGNEGTNEILTEGTVGEILCSVFKNKAGESAQTIADEILGNAIIAFPTASMPVEPGLLNGFDNYEVTGFEEGVMFGPAMGTIPFVGYVFTLADGADVEAFKTGLKDNANLRWNICTEAEELTVESKENKVFFLMSPKSLEDNAE